MDICGPSRSSGGSGDQELGEQRYRPAGGALALTRHRGRTRDVEMRPRVGLGEAGKEARRGDRARRAAAEVRHVREVALELDLILVEQRKLPGAIARVD